MKGHSAVVLGALAGLQAVAAQEVDVKQARARVEGTNPSTQCFPVDAAEHVFSVPDKGITAPCIAEQGLSSICEKLFSGSGGTPETNKAFRECLLGPGSTYQQDVMACVDCKVAHNELSKEQGAEYNKNWASALETFRNDTDPKTTVWASYVQPLFGDWSIYNGLAKPEGGLRPAMAISKYYKNAPAFQSIGTFTLLNRTYPEAALQDAGLLPKETVQRADPVGRLIDVQVRLGDPQASEQAGSAAPTAAPGTARPTTLVSAPAPKPFTANSTASAVRATDAAAAEAQVTVRMVHQDKDIIIQHKGGLAVKVVAILQTPRTVADAPEQRISQAEADKKQLPVCDKCQGTVHLQSAARVDVVQLQPATAAAKEIMEVFDDQSLSAEDRTQKVAVMVRAAVGLSVGVSGQGGSITEPASSAKKQAAGSGEQQRAECVAEKA